MAFQCARITEDFEHSEEDGPEVFHFVALEGESDWVEVEIREPLKPEHEPFVREMVEEYYEENVTCKSCGATGESWEDGVEHEPGCDDPKVSGTLPMRITRRFLRMNGADFVTIGEEES